MRWCATVLLAAALAAILAGCGRRSRVEAPPARAEGAAVSGSERSAEPDGPPPEPTAMEECGTDRRCRIARMRRVGAARRETRDSEARAQVLELDQEEERMDRLRLPRRFHPWVIENVITDRHFGAMAGIHAHPNFFFGISGTYFWGFNRYRSEMVDDGEFGRSVSHEAGVSAAFVVGGELRWLILEEIVTPYLGLGYHFLSGGAYQSTYGWMSDSKHQESSLEAHYGQAAAGIDVQFAWGLRFRAAFVVRPLIHVRARDAEHAILEDAESAFRDGFRLFGAEGGLGWSM